MFHSNCSTSIWNKKITFVLLSCISIPISWLFCILFFTLSFVSTNVFVHLSNFVEKANITFMLILNYVNAYLCLVKKTNTVSFIFEKQLYFTFILKFIIVLYLFSNSPYSHFCSSNIKLHCFYIKIAYFWFSCVYFVLFS
mgnify:CR=1 FL=1